MYYRWIITIRDVFIENKKVLYKWNFVLETTIAMAQKLNQIKQKFDNHVDRECERRIDMGNEI